MLLMSLQLKKTKHLTQLGEDPHLDAVSESPGEEDQAFDNNQWMRTTWMLSVSPQVKKIKHLTTING